MTTEWLRKYAMPIIGAMGCACGVAANAATVSATSGDVAIDTCATKTLSVGAAITIPYDAAWCKTNGAVASGRVTVVPVMDVEATNRTSTVAELSAKPGTCSYTCAATAPGAMRFTLAYYDGAGAQVGEALSGDLTYCLGAQAGAAIAVDTRADSLQAVAEAGGPAMLTFDCAWVTNGTAARVAMHCVRERRRKSGALESCVTNLIYETSAVAAGAVAYDTTSGSGGDFTLFCSFFDAAGKLLEEPLSAHYYFKPRFGFLYMVK